VKGKGNSYLIEKEYKRNTSFDNIKQKQNSQPKQIKKLIVPNSSLDITSIKNKIDFSNKINNKKTPKIKDSSFTLGNIHPEKSISEYINNHNTANEICNSFNNLTNNSINFTANNNVTTCENHNENFLIEESPLKLEDIPEKRDFIDNISNLHKSTQLEPFENKFGLIKHNLIELVNQTKDKSSIIKELDSIYKNILKISLPANSEDELFKENLMSDNNISNFNNISQVSNNISTSLSKPSLNLNNCNKEQSLSHSDCNSHLHLENESLKKENVKLIKKIEEIDNKFERLIKENENLKGFVKKKTQNIKSMEEVIKKFQNELNEVKIKQNLNVYKNKQKELLIPRPVNKNLSKSKFLNNNSICTYTKNKLMNNQSFNKSKLTKNSQEDMEYLQSSFSYLSIGDDEAKNIYYYPKKVNGEIVKNNFSIPKIALKNEVSSKKKVLFIK
jgi:hypothetical protein